MGVDGQKAKPAAIVASGESCGGDPTGHWAFSRSLDDWSAMSNMEVVSAGTIHLEADGVMRLASEVETSSFFDVQGLYLDGLTSCAVLPKNIDVSAGTLRTLTCEGDVSTSCACRSETVVSESDVVGRWAVDGDRLQLRVDGQTHEIGFCAGDDALTLVDPEGVLFSLGPMP